MPCTKVDAITGWLLINPNLGSFQVFTESRNIFLKNCYSLDSEERSPWEADHISAIQ